MTTITINESAEQQAPASQSVEVQDANGRRLKLKRPNALAQYRLVDAIGDSAENRIYLGMVLPLIYLEEVDGQPVIISTKRQVEALIQRLDHAGLAVLNDAIEANFARNEEGEVSRAKK